MLGISYSPYVGLQRVDATSNGFLGQMTPNISRNVIDLALEPFRAGSSGTASPSFLNNNALILPSPENTEKNKESRKVSIYRCSFKVCV